MSNEGYELNWDSQIENDGPEFTILPEGDYDFVVTEFERARHNGSDKLPPCWKAVVHIRIQGPEGIAIIRHNLFLHSITEGMLCAFFSAIGQRKKGEKISMDWGTVVGSKGKAKIGIRKWKNDEGREFTSNEVKKFYEHTPQKGFEAGRF
ncbi:phage protein [Syntrophobotulus glycolicus DSM 8271]|uniref:Phage protein n=1 Tax=Syntrophobotulus glycolicus (strain DSM 8271 / FlGlyR) TaxID=645991 RepID=F0SXE2_SYNGF|nr:hypothetical protein [Syntrophobotulus glycolicus]ADY54688.1 phage protein [Syntrophobotulus glycolicus DSM 8271]